MDLDYFVQITDHGILIKKEKNSLFGDKRKNLFLRQAFVTELPNVSRRRTRDSRWTWWRWRRDAATATMTPSASSGSSELTSRYRYLTVTFLFLFFCAQQVKSRVSDPHPFLADANPDPGFWNRMRIRIWVRIRIQGLILKVEKVKKIACTYIQTYVQIGEKIWHLFTKVRVFSFKREKKFYPVF